LSIDKQGTGYRLTATSSGLTDANSTAFTVTVATRLVFTVQPANTTLNAVITPAVQVTAFDDFGNAVTSFGGLVTVAITSGTGASGASLKGTTTVAAVQGTATFSDLFVNKAGTGYTLTATSLALVSAVSAAFNIAP